MRKFFPVLAAAAFVMASSHAFAGTSVKASVVPVGGDPKQGNCFQGAPLVAVTTVETPPDPGTITAAVGGSSLP
mgnify:CR=1 FL=1